MYIWFGIALALAFSGLVEAFLGFDIPFLVLRSTILFLLVLGMAYTYYMQEQSSGSGRRKVTESSELVDEV